MIDDAELMQFADGALDAPRRREIDAAVAASPELAAQLAALRASMLPFAAAFERQALPPVPAALAARVAELSRVGATAASGTNRKHAANAGLWQKLAANASSWPKLAAAFGAGALCLGLAYEASSKSPFASKAPQLVQAIADYHEFYARETVANVAEDAGFSKRLLAEVKAADGLPVRVPDLRSAGLDFKRVQRLRFHDKPLIQIVYLPDRGAPIALCITAQSGADTAPSSRKFGAMDAVTWRHDRMAYVLVGANPQANLLSLAEQIASGKTAALYDAS